MDKLTNLPMDGGALPAQAPEDPMYSGLMNALMGNVANLPMNGGALPAQAPEDPMYSGLMNALMGNFWETEAELRRSGFQGFYFVKDLRTNNRSVPLHSFSSGIYLVIRDWIGHPKFLSQVTGESFGFPTPQHPDIHELETKWVENALILYVGQSKTLHQRIHELIWSDTSNNPAHDAGKYLWKIEQAEYLKICWKFVQNEKQEEIDMLEAFRRMHQGRLPFANLNKPKPLQYPPNSLI